MDLHLTAEQEQLVASVAALYERHAAPDAVRAAEPGGHDPDLWARLVELGAVAMAVGEAAGGWGATALDLALVAEQHGRAVAPAPLVEAQVAARLLERVGTEESSAVLAGALSGDRLVTLALHPVVEAGGAAVVRGVPAGTVADSAIVRRGDEIVLVDLADPGVEGGRVERRSFENLGSLPLADVTITEVAITGDTIAGGTLTGGGVSVLAGGAAAVAAHEAAIDDWLRLTAAALVGLGARALEIGVEYVKERHAFGVPIGSFQAVAHPLADSAAALDGARLLAWEAAWAADDAPDRAAELAGLAFGFAGDAARDVTARSLHVHGGYGFMMEYDIQLYWRRARAWTNVWAEPAQGYRRAVADRIGV